MKTILNSALAVNRYLVPPLLLCAATYIFCMHWFLLMADSLVAGITTETIPAPVLSTIIAYYTVIFGPMTWMIKLFILLFFACLTLQLLIKEIPWYVRWLAFLTNVPLILNGVFFIIPSVDRLILNTETAKVESQVVRAVHNAHLISLFAAGLVIVLQIIMIIRMQRQPEKK